MPKGVYPHYPNYKLKQCIQCGDIFKPTSPVHIYCNKCRGDNKKEQQRLAAKRYYHCNGYDVCPQCGQRKQKTSELCRKCRYKYIAEHPETHPNWCGGKHLTRGYVKVWTPDGRRLEHHVVWETYHGMKLPKGYIIHHINGVKADNRPENLIAVKRYDHEYQTLLKVTHERIRELEELLGDSKRNVKVY